MKKNVFLCAVLAALAASVSAQSKVPDTFVRINGGTFTMGVPADEPYRVGNEVQHQVTVSAFYMGKYEVTQKEYEEVMGTNPSELKSPNLPVEQVSWFDAVEYCNKRSQKEGLTPAYTISSAGGRVAWNRNANGYRLPTEAEWEYACRAGTTTPFSTGNNVTTDFAPNPWGLYDMHGNVFEWCWDWYGRYSSGAQTDPVGAASGSYRVIRGGSWYAVASLARSVYRDYYLPYYRDGLIGFRLVRSLAGSGE